MNDVALGLTCSVPSHSNVEMDSDSLLLTCLDALTLTKEQNELKSDFEQ